MRRTTSAGQRRGGPGPKRAPLLRLKGMAPRRPPSLIERQLKAFVAGDETEGAIEAMRLGPALVARQLHHAAAALAGYRHEVAEQPAPKPAAAPARSDPHRFDQRPLHAAPAKPGDDRELGAADDLTVAVEHVDGVVRIGFDRLEGGQIGCKRRALAVLPELVVAQERGERRQILFPRRAQDTL